MAAVSPILASGTRQNFASDVYPKSPRNMDTIQWYHYNLTQHTAETILMSGGKTGSYLLRDSRLSPGGYTLSVRAKRSVKHFPVDWNGREFNFGMATFSCVSELVDHFNRHPVIGDDTGVLIMLKYPYPQGVEEPSIYDDIRVHAEWGQPQSKSHTHQAKVNFSINSKEGFLTKKGYYIHTWRTRWFVLFKNELKYYKTRESQSPIKIINLADVTDVLADATEGKQTHFRIITSYRTFFVYAGSAQEAEDWIKILQWKLMQNGGDNQFR